MLIKVLFQVVLIDVFKGVRTFVSLLLLETAAQIYIYHCFLHSVSIIECYIFLNKLQPMKLRTLLAEAVWSTQTSV